MRRILWCGVFLLLLSVGLNRVAERSARSPARVAGPVMAQTPPGDQSRAGDSERVARYRATVERRDRPVDSYNLGTALLLDDRPAEAREPLQRADGSARERVRVYGQYNLGVASGLVGRAEGAPDAQRSALLAARQAFRQVLRDVPADEDARWNLELIEKWLEEAEESSGGQEGGEQPPSQAGGQGAEQGDSGGSQQRPLTHEEAAALLRAAGDAEQSIRDRFLGRNRFREPTVERNW
jgi:hypothetical protein